MVSCIAFIIPFLMHLYVKTKHVSSTSLLSQLYKKALIRQNLMLFTEGCNVDNASKVHKVNN